MESFPCRFRHETVDVEVYSSAGSRDEVDIRVLHHDLFATGGAGSIYHNDPDSGPYAVDADKFALFSAAAAEFVQRRKPLPAAIHLHDWHTGMLAVLRHFDPTLTQLRSVRQVFTIHNLSYQGQRPMSGDSSSLAAWYPWLGIDDDLVTQPGDAAVFNPMATAIRLADRVNTVSPSYAREICRPSMPECGFIGGEGLESVLVEADDAGKLMGILNGCDYLKTSPARPGWQALVTVARKAIETWQQTSTHPAHDVALNNLSGLPKRRPLHVLSSVGRVVDQKMRLFFEATPGGPRALESILATLGKNGTVFVLGDGEARYEQALVELARVHDNLVFLCGYSGTVSDALFAAGDLFLMPSSFEPCGISQMLAMRAGQPCVVHGVGGLNDTVDDEVNGFVFGGDTPAEQAGHFVLRVEEALARRHNDPLYWHKLRDAARDARYDWAKAAQRYARELYDIDPR